MDSLNFSNFLFERVHGTINQSRYIQEVNIDYELEDNFGNQYITVDYKVVVNQDFHNLSKSEQDAFLNFKPHYIFTISTHAHPNRGSEKKKLLKILEFKNIYESLAAYVNSQLEHALNPETLIKIKGIDLWPEANYAKKHLDSALYIKHKHTIGSPYEYDVLQWDRLHKLSNDSKKNYTENKSHFSITDIEINHLFGLEPNDIRFILLNHKVPIKVSGFKTIEKINIHMPKLAEALKARIKDNYYRRDNNVYQSLITYLYDNFLQSEKAEIIDKQKSDFLTSFSIQKGDILQLKDNRIVVASSIGIDSRNAIVIEYLNLKVNLEVGERKRKTLVNHISYVLSQSDFLSYRDYTPSRRISLLDKWMSKRKTKMMITAFEPDLTT